MKQTTSSFPWNKTWTGTAMMTFLSALFRFLMEIYGSLSVR